MLTPKQIELRKGRITSSVAGAALGKNPHKTPVAAWLEVMGRAQFAGNRATLRGDKLQRSTLEYGIECIPGAVAMIEPETVQHPSHAWAADSCDALYLDKWGNILAAGEGKTVGSGTSLTYGNEGTDDIPEHVIIQACWHLVHWPEAPFCAVPVLVGGNDFYFRYYEVQRDDEWNGLLMQDLERWHRDYVVADKMPPVQGDDSEFLRSLFPRNTRDNLTPDLEIDMLVHRILEAKEVRKRAQKREKDECARLVKILGEYGGILGTDYSVSYKNNQPSVVIDWHGYAKALAECVADKDVVSKLITQFTSMREGNRPLNVDAL